MASIKHVVVLMLENRSFDHLLGFLGDRFTGQPFAGLSGNERAAVDPWRDEAGVVGVERIASSDAYVTAPDPGHEYADVALQLYGKDQFLANAQPVNNGFVCSYGAQVGPEGTPVGADAGKHIMRCVDPSFVPVLSALATNFVVCDHWFSSVPYKGRVAPVVEQYGGRYIVLGGKTDLVEGNWRPTFPVIIEFPGLEQAHRWYGSDEYRELKALRLSAVRSNAVFIEGL